MFDKNEKLNKEQQQLCCAATLRRRATIIALRQRLDSRDLSTGRFLHSCTAMHKLNPFQVVLDEFIKG
jgi:hypothetical protein